jgi:pyrimidine-nucleoside phosphorylase
MLLLGKIASDHADAWRRMRESISSGRALAKFVEIVESQGGDTSIVDDPSTLPRANATSDFLAGRNGFISDVSPRTIGHGIIALGGGRQRIEDDVDPGVGFVIHAKPGTQVSRGDLLATVHARDNSGIRHGHAVLAEAITVADDPGTQLPLVSDRITSEGSTKWNRPA